VFSSPGKQTTSLVNGLFYADAMGNLLKTEFNACVVGPAQWPGRRQQQQLHVVRLARYGDYGIVNAPTRPAPPIATRRST
jgi:hypothetical protein